jgi:hypothetical protein
MERAPSVLHVPGVALASLAIWQCEDWLEREHRGLTSTFDPLLGAAKRQITDWILRLRLQRGVRADRIWV